MKLKCSKITIFCIFIADYTAMETKTTTTLGRKTMATMRIKDPLTGRWLAPDPMAGKYPGLSPFVYCAGEPVNGVDPDGMVFTPQSAQIVEKYERGIQSKFQRASRRVDRLMAKFGSNSTSEAQNQKIGKRIEKNLGVMAEMAIASIELFILKNSSQVYDIQDTKQEKIGDNGSLFGETSMNLSTLNVEVKLYSRTSGNGGWRQTCG